MDTKVTKIPGKRGLHLTLPACGNPTAIAGMTIAMQDADGLKFLLTDHLGSVIAITDDMGSILSEQRYLPFGEVREDVGTITQTDFSYTGQRALEDMGLMDYKARFYSPLLGRFLQPDTIVPNPGNPQMFNRYSYVNNAPTNFSDPTGHFIVGPSDCTELSCSDDEEDTNEPDLDFTGYSDWEVESLLELYNNGGQEAKHGVEYILANDIHITVDSGWQSGDRSRSAWYLGDHLIVLNVDMGYSLSSRPDDWGLSLIIHEAMHIEQGTNIAWSKMGEMIAWQIGIDVAENLGWYKELGYVPLRDKGVNNANTVEEFSQAIQQHDKNYWNAKAGTFIGNFICVGLCSLPDWPIEIPTYQPPIWLGT